MIDTQQQEPTQPPTVLLYDADAPQRVPMKVERHGKLYLVAHNFRGIKDDDIIEFERTKDVRLSDADDSESDEQSAMAVTSKQFAAAIALWEKLAESVENYALKQPEGEWQKEVSAKDKAFAVTGVLLAVEFVELPVCGRPSLPARRRRHINVHHACDLQRSSGRDPARPTCGERG